MKISFLLPFLWLAICTNTFLLAQSKPIATRANATLSIEKRVEDLVSLLTLEEKISQMVNNSPAIERLGIPAYNWWNETLHGVARSPYHVTSFPQAIGMAASWNPESCQKSGDFFGNEGRGEYNP
jgi:beta-glucosidase